MAIFSPDFHFLRPLWFLALAPALALFGVLWLARLRRSGWDRAINRTLLPHLLDARPGARQRWPLVLLLAAWLLTAVGLAGPVWQRLPEPVRQKEDALVIIQDLSLSFYAQDLSPDRLTRARHKLTDILKNRREGLTALIVYAGDAHVVTPLTDDTRTIDAMVSDLDPGIMPSYGSNLKSAVELALRLFSDSGLNRGRLLLLTDEVSPDQAAAVTDLLRGQNFTLSVIGVGTPDGAPISTSDGGFLKDDRGKIVVPRLEPESLARLAAENGGRYSDIRIDDSDFQELLADRTTLPRKEDYRETKLQFDRWQDQGYWLAVLLLPLGLLAFRRGWLLASLFLAFWLVPTGNSYAMGWRDLWLRPDQQAAQALAANRPKEAASLFRSQPWRGASHYRAGDYEQAAAAFGRRDNGDDNYNRGNALAKLGRLQEAIDAYDRALKLDPGMADARANRELVAKLQQQKEQQDKEQGKGQKTEDKRQKEQQGQHGQQGQEGEQGKGQKAEGKSQKDRQGQPEQQKQPGPAGQQVSENRENPQNQAGQQEQKQDRQEQPGKSGAGSQRKAEGKQAKVGQDRLARDGKDDLEKKKAAAADQMENDRLSPEQRQALAQWLRQIPDDPGGLLRRKFQYQYQQNQANGDNDQGKIW